MKNSLVKSTLIVALMLSMAALVPVTHAMAQDVPPTEPPPVDQPLQVTVDVKPGNCVDPVNTKSRGVLTVVVLGSAELDVNKVDVDTIVLGAPGVVVDDPASAASPVRSSIVDGFVEGDCGVQEGQDGIDDLVLKFRTQDVVRSLEGLKRGKNPGVELKLVGDFIVEEPPVVEPPAVEPPAEGTGEEVAAPDFEGTDSILVINNIKKVKPPKHPKKPHPHK